MARRRSGTVASDRGRSRSRPRRKSRRRSPIRRMLVVAGVVGALALSAWVAWLDYRIRDEFEGKRWAVPARVFARPLDLAPGAPLTADAIEAELALAGYRRVRSAFRPASFERNGGRLRFVTREFRFPDGVEPSRSVTVSVSGGRIAGVAVDGEDRARVRVDPAEIARVYPAHREDRVLLRLADVPAAFLAVLLEVEDRRFHRHFGIDPIAVVRAAWRNLRAGRTVQGGSTLTQQLAKNFFLTAERTFSRKLKEALIALLLEWRYSKDELLEAISERGVSRAAGRPCDPRLRPRGPPLLRACARRSRSRRDGAARRRWCAARPTTIRGAAPGTGDAETPQSGDRSDSKRKGSPARVTAERARREPLGVTPRPPLRVDAATRRSSIWCAGSSGATIRTACCAARGCGSSRPSIPTVQRASESALDAVPPPARAPERHSREASSRPRSRSRMPDPARCSPSWATASRAAPGSIAPSMRCVRSAPWSSPRSISPR